MVYLVLETKELLLFFQKILLYISAIAVGVLNLVSCTDVLNKPAVDTFNAQLVFSDLNVVNAYLGKCYDRMGGNTDSGILGAREDLLVSGTDQTLCIHRPANYNMIKGTLSPDNNLFFTNDGYGGY